MWRLSRVSVLAAFLFTGGAELRTATGQIRQRGLIPPPVARHVGLQQAWMSHVEMNRARARVAHMTLDVSDKITYTVFEVMEEDRKAYFSEQELDNLGSPLGLDAADRQGQTLADTLRALGKDPKVEKLTVPAVTLYVQTTQSDLNAIDGETGQNLWATRVGNPDYPISAPAANEDFVAMINGMQLYMLDAADGKLVWERPLAGVPGAGPAMSGSFAFVPMLRGSLEAYPIDDPKKMPDIYSFAGRAMIRPTVTPSTISWSSDQSYLFVSRADRLEMLFRLETGSPMVSQVTYQPPDRLFAVSSDGFVYSIAENNGEILWRHSIGEATRHRPIPIGDSLYIITDYAGMYSLSAEDGQQQWIVPGIRQFLARSTDRVYCMTRNQRLVVLDAKSGQQLGSIPTAGLDLVFPNPQTDRIYVGSTLGQLQCLREVQSPWPLRHIPPVDEQKATEPRPDQPDAAPAEPPPADESMFGEQAPPANLFGPGPTEPTEDAQTQDPGEGESDVFDFGDVNDLFPE